MKQVYFKTLAEFKRLAIKGAGVKGGYYGKYKDDVRKVVGVQSNGVWLYKENDKRSFFELPKAKNCEIKDGTLSIFENRVKVGASDIPAEVSWLKYDLETGKYKESDLIRYRKLVAEYTLWEL